MNKELINLKIEMKIDYIASVLNQEYNSKLIKDEWLDIKKVLKSTVTYEALTDIKLNYYQLSTSKLLEMFKKEFNLDEYLDNFIPKSKNSLQELANRQIKNNIKRKILLEGSPIDTAIEDVINTPLKNKNLNLYKKLTK